MSRPLWTIRLIKAAFPYRRQWARLTRVPLVGRLLGDWLFEGDRLYYLPMDRMVRVNETVEAAPQFVLPSQVAEHFVEQSSFRWLMDRCICRDAGHCQDYPIDLGCLFLGEAARGINPRLGRSVTKDEALVHLRRCREAGLVHLVGRDKFDTVWLGVGPGTRLMVICNCCPCCCLWRVLPDIAPDVSSRVMRMPGVTVEVTDRCVGCGTCTHTCFVGAIRLDGGHATIGDSCRGCGRCASKCPQHAIEVHVDDGHFVDEVVGRLSGLIDLS